MMKKDIYIGIMTGTSVDAIDIAAARFDDGAIESDAIEIVAITEFPFTEELQSFLKSMTYDITLKDLSQLNVRYSEEIADAVNQFISANNLNRDEINAIGFHGQTLWHNPEEEEFLSQPISSTYQLGSGAVLAQKTGVDVITDFRSADMAVGGQGAPLIPIFDFAFLGENDSDTIILNIGGIANITYLPKSCRKEDIIAFDTGPGNCLIDLAMQKLFEKKYDNNGETARAGKVNDEALNQLLQIEYISKSHPKSTGKEMFNEVLLKKHNIFSLPSEDVIATLTHYTAKSIATNIDKITKDKFALKIAGGGARNSLLVELLDFYLPNANVTKPVLDGIDISDGREALLMCYLAFLRVNERTANLPTVTGASKEVILGSLTQK